MKTNKIPNSVGIHDGTFHADEVTACAILILFGLVDRDKILRTRDPQRLATCEYVCDVGGIYDPEQKYFDHHQADYQGSLSSAGMILAYFKQQGIISDEKAQFFEQSLIAGVDAHDNGRSSNEPGVCTFSHAIANFNPVIHQSSEEALNGRFQEALDFTLGLVGRLNERFEYLLECRKLIKEAMDRYHTCLYFDQSIPWVEGFFALEGEKHSALFILMPAKDHWKLRCIPPNFEHRMQVRVSLPQEWAGLLEDQLKEVSGIPGAIFCHKGRFTSVWETKEDALLALEKVLALNGIQDEDAI